MRATESVSRRSRHERRAGMLTAEIALDCRDHLGEGPHWDAAAGQLVSVDIDAGLIHRWDPATGRRDSLACEPPTSFAIPCEHGGLAVGGRDAVSLVAEDGAATRVLAHVEAPASNRFNDGKCDAAGRLWAGTMSTVREAGAAALHRILPGGRIDRVVEGTTISNGLGWSPDGQTMYFIDSTTQRVDAFEFDLAGGELGARREFVRVDPDDGLPDGLAVDAEGGVWVCLFGGGQLRRYDPGGRLAEVVELPVTNPTSPTFGGPGLDLIYVTSARHRLTPEQLERESLAGALLAVRPAVAGLPAARFGGGLDAPSDSQ